MRLTTRGRYGVRAMLELAAHSSPHPLAAQELALRQDIPVKYLNQLLIPLRSTGLVKSVRGARGGFILGRDPETITLLEIVEALEGPLVVSECVREPEGCDRSDTCAARWLWGELGQRAAQFLEGITLADLVRKSEAQKK